MAGVVGTRAACILDRATFVAGMAPSVRVALQIAVLALACAAAAATGPAIALSGDLGPIRPIAGLAGAAFFLCGAELWPGVLIGGFIGALVAGSSPLASALVAGGAIAEGLVAVALLRRLGFRPTLARLVDVPVLAVSASLAAAVGGAVASISSVLERNPVVPDGLPFRWLFMAAGDALGIFIVGSALFVWAVPEVVLGAATRRLQELLAISAVALVAAVLFFDPLDITGAGQAVAFPLIPVVVWVAFRVGPRGNALAAIVYTALAIVATQRGVRLALASTAVCGTDGSSLVVTVSAGCAAADDAGLRDDSLAGSHDVDRQGEALIRSADIALSMAKRGGRNAVVAV